MPRRLNDKDLLARLVEHDSTSAVSNRPIADFACAYLEGVATSIERDETPDGEKVNVIARTGPPPDAEREGLLLCGHLDVVPAVEPDWRTDPFVLTERGDAWYGRGACDMKGFVALAMNAFVEAATRGPARPLALLLTADEEIGSLGAQRLAATRPGDRRLPRSAVIGEPTSLRVVRMHKGHLKLRVTVRGRAAHSGSPHLGRNAIEPAARIVAGLAALREELARERRETSAFFPDVPHPVLNVGRVEGGDAVNVIPARCVIDVGVRMLPGMDSAPVIERVRHIAAAVHDDDDRATSGANSRAGEVEVDVEVVNDNPPMLLDEAAAINRMLCAQIGQRESVGVSFASDAGVLQRDFGVECVLFGPGTMDVAHRANEHVPVADMTRAREILAALVERGCFAQSPVGHG